MPTVNIKLAAIESALTITMNEGGASKRKFNDIQGPSKLSKNDLDNKSENKRGKFMEKP